MTDNYFEEEEFTTQFNGQTVWRIIAQTKSHWHWMLGFLITIVIVSILDGYFTFLGKRIVDEGIIAGDRQTLIHIVTIYGALILVQAVNVFGFIYLAGVLGERVRYDLRKKLFNNLQDLSLSYYSRTPVGWIMSRVTSDTERVADLITWGMLDVTWASANIATSAFFMLRINWKLGLVVLTILPVIIWVGIQFRKKILVEYRNVRKINSKITGAYNENITGVRVVKALGREEENMNEFGKLTGEMYNASYRAAWLSALFLPAVQIIALLP
jgi:ATP-binding cassette subfamily B protein